MKVLRLLRHATASPSDGDDRERPLVARGREEASAVGRHLAADRTARAAAGEAAAPAASPPPGAALAPEPASAGADGAPSVALCSPALRARETLEIVCAQLSRPPRVVVDPALYLASPGGILGRVQDLEADVREVLVVGHNPGIAGLARALAGADAPAAFAFPPASLAVLAFAGVAWEDLAPGRARLLELVRPPGPA